MKELKTETNYKMHRFVMYIMINKYFKVLK